MHYTNDNERKGDDEKAYGYEKIHNDTGDNTI